MSPVKNQLWDQALDQVKDQVSVQAWHQAWDQWDESSKKSNAGFRTGKNGESNSQFGM